MKEQFYNIQFLRFWKTIIWAIIVFSISSFPGNKVDHVPFLNIPHIDKIIHAGMYFILSFSFLFEINNNSFYQTLRLKLSIIILILSISYGFILEILQSFLFIERSGDFYDFLANSLGCILAFFFFKFLNRRYQNT